MPAHADAVPASLAAESGPLVAALDRSDKHHARCAALLESADGPLLIPTTVIVEVCWLVEERPDIEATFLESIAASEFESDYPPAAGDKKQQPKRRSPSSDPRRAG